MTPVAIAVIVAWIVADLAIIVAVVIDDRHATRRNRKRDASVEACERLWRA